MCTNMLTIVPFKLSRCHGKATGEVYSWGRGDDGRLGHGDNNWKYVPRRVKSLAGQRIVFVNCGSYHTAAVAGECN